MHTESSNMYYENGDKGEDIEKIDGDVDDDADEDIDDNFNLDVHPESGHHSISGTDAPLGKLSLVEKSKTFTTYCDFFCNYVKNVEGVLTWVELCEIPKTSAQAACSSTSLL